MKDNNENIYEDISCYVPSRDPREVNIAARLKELQYHKEYFKVDDGDVQSADLNKIASSIENRVSAIEEKIESGISVKPDLSVGDEKDPAFVKGVIRQESLPDGYPYDDRKEVNIDWDRNTDGLDNAGTWYRVSDLTPSSTLLLESGEYYSVNILDGDQSGGILPSYLVEGTNAYYLDDPVNIAVALQDGGTLTDGTVLPKAGIYFYSYELRYTEKLKFSSGNFNALDEKYLPDIPAEKVKNIPSKVFRAYYGETTSSEISSNVFDEGRVVFLIDSYGVYYLNGSSMTGFDFVNVDTAGGYIRNIHVNNDNTWSRSEIKIGS